MAIQMQDMLAACIALTFTVAYVKLKHGPTNRQRDAYLRIQLVRQGLKVDGGG